MSTTIVLARHGRTAWHADNRYAGVSDIDIDGVGRAQALVLAEWARGYAPDALYCSPLRRSRQTAAPVGAALGLEPAADERIREVAFGIAEGRTLAQLAPAVAARFEADPVTGYFPQGEDPAAAAERAREWVVDTAAAHPGGRVLAIAHNTLMRLLVCRVMLSPLGEYRRLLPKVASTGLTTLRVTDGRIALESYNATPGPDPAAGGVGGAAAERETRR
ncbi:putative phosphoglycerate mutase [Murinocardiopsis flavida]|uniref:Putative phosphoglycerate mutase n=1 Tax=Murinocardiopsis flavida TaxID=645275 RepID=A0A2P8DQ21_9ACTN|nr:histidine phosphatase family protein [Murinocardiopsis flavida]PSK99315.1 putative phosphoglycerate mutase [Murinocardiopsis flavida]